MQYNPHPLVIRYINRNFDSNSNSLTLRYPRAKQTMVTGTPIDRIMMSFVSTLVPDCRINNTMVTCQFVVEYQYLDDSIFIKTHLFKYIVSGCVKNY